MTALYQLVDQYKVAESTLSNLDLDAQTVTDTLDSLTGDIEYKAQNVAMFIRNLEVTVEAIKEHEDRQATRRKAMEKRASELKAYLSRAMTDCRIEKISGPGISLFFKNTSAVIVDNEKSLPAAYMRFPPQPAPEPDKKAIASALKDGKEIPGAHLEHRKFLQIN